MDLFGCTIYVGRSKIVAFFKGSQSMSSLRPILAMAAMENAMIEGKIAGLCDIAILQGGVQRLSNAQINRPVISETFLSHFSRFFTTYALDRAFLFRTFFDYQPHRQGRYGFLLIPHRIDP